MNKSQQKALLDAIAMQPVGRSVQEIEQSIASIQAERKRLQAEINEIRRRRAARAAASVRSA